MRKTVGILVGTLVLLVLCTAALARFVEQRRPRIDDPSPDTTRSWWREVDPSSTLAQRFAISLPELSRDWTAEERVIPVAAPGFLRYQLGLDDSHGRSITISVFRRDEELGRELARDGTAVDQRTLRTNGVAADSHDATVLKYTSDAGDGGAIGILLDTDAWLYQVTAAGFDASSDPAIFRDLRLSGRALPVLPVQSSAVLPSPCCGEKDVATNTYSCCDKISALGNCTWYCEFREPGSNNFKFGGSGTGRDAFRWLSRTSQYNTAANSIGGTIPIPGAIMVFTTAYSANSGHVAYIESVAADGSLNVREQNYCASSCTVAKTYTVDNLRLYLAGYIYPSTTRPEPTPKLIGGAIGAQTSVDDLNRTNVYNFTTEGPGFFHSFNTNERMWGTGGTGDGYFHWMLSSTAATNSGKWAINIGASGLYKIEAFIPSSTLAAATRARYKVAMNGSITYSSPVNQSKSHGLYVQLVNPVRGDGYWYFPSGSTGNGVRLEDNYGGNNPEASVTIALDALRFTRMKG